MDRALTQISGKTDHKCLLNLGLDHFGAWFWVCSLHSNHLYYAGFSFAIFAVRFSLTFFWGGFMLGKIEGRIPCRDLFCMVSASFFFILFPFLQITFQANLKKDTRKEFRILCHLIMVVLDSYFSI